MDDKSMAAIVLPVDVVTLPNEMVEPILTKEPDPT